MKKKTRYDIAEERANLANLLAYVMDMCTVQVK